jgi:reactive intermediate/imine deaminase
MANEKIIVSTSAAPPPLPQFVQAVKHNGLLFCSGSIGVDPATGNIVEGTVADRTLQALKNLTAVLEAGGSSLDQVLKVNIYLTDMANFATMNEAWDKVFTGSKPVSPEISRTRGECVSRGRQDADKLII